MKQYDRILTACFVLMFPHLLQAQYATKVFDFLPAPGQFTNTSIGISSASTNVVGNTSSMVSLGSFGGTIIVGFDQPIVNDPQNPYGVDFSIEGNSFGGNLYGQWCEPGAVQVMKDLNHNGLPDDGEWYELAGSDYWLSTTCRNVTMTYYNPHYSKGHAVTWKCDNGDYGAMVSNRFHTQPYYPDPFDFGTVILDSVSFTGNRIRGTIDMSSPSYLNPYRAPVFGYCDSKGNNSPLTSPQNPYTSGTDGFDLSWAVDKEGNYIDLDTVNFVKIYNAGFANIGWLGEWSTEVLSVAITSPDPTYVVQDYYRNYIGITQLQVLKNQTCHYDGLLFKNGRPQTDGTPRWWTSNPDVATVDDDGNLTGVKLGETWLYFSQKNDIKPDSAFVKIVELIGVVLEMEGNNPNISSDTTSLIVGEKIFIIGECTDSRTNVLNATIANRFVYEPLVWTTSNPAVGTIDNGLFTGIAPGISYVYARSTSSPTLYDSIKVIVQARSDVKSISNYIKIPFFLPTGTYAASDLFTTDTNAEIILDSAVAKHGNMSTSIVKNVFDYSFISGVYTTDTVHFVLTVFGQTHDFDIVFDYNPAVKTTAKQLVFTYTGIDGTKALKAWYPDSDELKTITELTDETVSDMQVDGAYLYVATDKHLLRYNLSTYRAENTLSLDYTAHKLIVYENRLYVSATQNGVAKLFAYFKSDLSPVTTITLPAEATALAATNSKVYALLNNVSSSALSIITADVNTVSLDKTINWGTYGLNASDLIAKDTMLYVVRRKSTSTTSAVLSYHTTTGAFTVTEIPTVEYLSTNTSAAIESMTGDSILLKNKRGFTPFNTKTLALGATTYMRDNSRYPSGAAYDIAEKKYYVTHVGTTDSKGSVFTSAFAIDKNFTGTGIAPGLVRFSPALTVNEQPAVKAAIGSQAIVENKTKLVVTVNKTNSFSDTENNFNIYPKTTDTLFSWARSGVNLVYTAYFDGTVTADSVVTVQVEAIDQYGCPITNAFSITIKPRIYAPYTSTVITDQRVSVNSPDLILPLKDVFEFFSANVEAQNIKTVTGNSNPTLVTAIIDVTNDSLTLSFAKDQSGEALITLRGTTEESEPDEGKTPQSKYIEFSFKVTVTDNGVTELLPVSTTQIQVYPTLTKGKITVALYREQPISVYNITGTIVKSINGKQGLNEIDLSAYPNGLYLVKTVSNAVKVMLNK